MNDRHRLPLVASIACLLMACGASSDAPAAPSVTEIATNSSAHVAEIVDAQPESASLSQQEPPADMPPEFAEIMAQISGQTSQSLMQVAGAASATGEICGDTTRADTDRARENARRTVMKDAPNLSPAQLDQTFNEAYATTKADAAASNPAQVRQQCQELRNMETSGSLNELNKAVQDLEAAARKMQQR